ncbi:hypothetical protein WAF17_21045 [Bernardetia sp. ABR2-2B]|uniref:hypothetical protein n=1 Tax=Bernardetia sp. ABR2-2B TaxID=3127472 RepID=UPI0030CAE167
MKFLKNIFKKKEKDYDDRFFRTYEDKRNESMGMGLLIGLIFLVIAVIVGLIRDYVLPLFG